MIQINKGEHILVVPVFLERIDYFDSGSHKAVIKLEKIIGGNEYTINVDGYVNICNNTFSFNADFSDIKSGEYNCTIDIETKRNNKQFKSLANVYCKTNN